MPLSDLGKRPLVMGIVNVTPDSFSGDGLLLPNHSLEAALAYAAAMVADGADILDIGGESTRPNAVPVAADEEVLRTAPVIHALRDKFPHLPLSIDTTKPAVARAALEAGATILNDVSGVHQSPEMRALAASTGAYLVLMHNKASPQATTQTALIGGEYLAPATPSITADVAQELAFLASQALGEGVEADRLILDPGIGFGKTVEQNLQLINQLDQLSPLGFPLLLGPSRKSFIGRVLDLPPEERLEGTAASVTLGVLRGASILRVHDVKFMARVVKMTTALCSS